MRVSPLSCAKNDTFLDACLLHIPKPSDDRSGHTTLEQEDDSRNEPREAKPRPTLDRLGYYDFDDRKDLHTLSLS